MRTRSFVLDAALALTLAAVGVLEAVTHGDGAYAGTASPVVSGVLVAAGALPLALRRVRPVPTLVAVSALTCLPHLAVDYDLVVVGGLCVVVVAAETVGRYTRRPLHRWGPLIPVPGLAILCLVEPGFVGDAPVYVALVVGGWTFGVLLRALLERRAALRSELAARAEAEALLTERAVAAERTRIARDLHDVIAHCVSVMVLQAGAARLRIDKDPAGSATAIAHIERTGHEALVELQRVLGLLRGDAQDDAGASVAALDDLVAEVRAAGLAVRVRVEGDPAGLPPGLDRSLYRVVQESLTNALKHGGGTAVEVRIAVADSRVELEVENAVGATPRPALPGGNGQAGMRERVAAFGGVLQAGLDAGRYRVHAVVPVESVP